MLDFKPSSDAQVSAGALLLFDRAMRVHAIRADIVRAAQELNRLSEHQLSDLGLNRKDIEDVIDRYL